MSSTIQTKVPINSDKWTVQKKIKLKEKTSSRGITLWDIAFFLLLAAGAAYLLMYWPDSMNIYEKWILVGMVIVLSALGWYWPAIRKVALISGSMALLAIGMYDGNIANGDQKFWLKYLLSSQSSILWMSAMFIIATVSYWLGYFVERLSWMGSLFTWLGIGLGFSGLLVRWREGHLIAYELGHIPVSNLYEVFILFALITTLFYLFYERRYQTRSLGGFVMLVVSAAVIFLLWYTFERDAAVIRPLNNALDSWWMKLHVPANFVGYGTFALAAMVGFAYIVKHHENTTSWKSLLPVLIVGAMLVAEVFIFGNRGKISIFWLVYFAISLVLVAGILMIRKRLARKLPSFEVLDDIMYKSIAVGFVFFTIATVLGAFWAADAWGTYWQWDPKETWALVVWLNYATWLHLRFIKGMRGLVAAYWALIGLVITTFAFIGVNIFLSGLHSYGQL